MVACQLYFHLGLPRDTHPWDRLQVVGQRRFLVELEAQRHAAASHDDSHLGASLAALRSLDLGGYMVALRQ